MAIRAYKLAEELGIDKADLVAKAGEMGLALKSAMASLEDDEAELLRRKLGKPAPRGAQVTEKRVEVESGAAVIRRRKKAAPAPEPAPVAVAPAAVGLEPTAAVEAAPVVEPEPLLPPEPEPLPGAEAPP